MCWQLDPLINGWLVAWRGPQTCAVGNVFIPPTATGLTIAAQMTDRAWQFRQPAVLPRGIGHYNCSCLQRRVDSLHGIKPTTSETIREIVCAFVAHTRTLPAMDMPVNVPVDDPNADTEW